MMWIAMCVMSTKIVLMMVVVVGEYGPYAKMKF